MKVLSIDEQWKSRPHLWANGLLAQAGVEMRFVAQPGSPAVCFLRERGLTVEELPLRGRLDLGSLLRLRSVLRTFQPEVIQAYTAKTCWLAVWAQWPRKRAKVVLYRGAIRDTSAWSPNDWLLFRSRWVDAYDCLSVAVARHLIEAGVPAEKAFVNYYGHCPEWYTPTERGRDQPPKQALFRIGCVANYRKVKGLESLVDAADILQTRGCDFELMIVGRDERQTLADYVSKAACRKRVTLTGPRRSPWDLLRTFDCAVIPSLQEGLSRAALEALACGVPLVASATGGLTEIVESGVNGLLVPPRSPGELATAIERVLKDAELQTRFRRNGLEVLRRKFSPEQTRDRLMDLYRGLSNSSRNGGFDPHSSGRVG